MLADSPRLIRGKLPKLGQALHVRINSRWHLLCDHEDSRIGTACLKDFQAALHKSC